MLSTTENFSFYNFIFSTGKPVATRLNFACTIQKSKGSQERFAKSGGESDRS